MFQFNSCRSRRNSRLHGKGEAVECRPSADKESIAQSPADVKGGRRKINDAMGGIRARSRTEHEMSDCSRSWRSAAGRNRAWVCGRPSSFRWFSQESEALRRVIGVYTPWHKSNLVAERAPWHKCCAAPQHQHSLHTA